MTKLTQKTAKELLIKEIEFVQKSISQYDKFSFQIKGWCITLWSGIVFLGIQYEIDGIFYIFLSFVIGFLFWIIDSFFKLYQRASISRMKSIQNYLNNEFKECKYDVFIYFDLKMRLTRKKEGINSMKKYIKDISFKRCLFVRNVWIIYYWLIVSGIFLGLYSIDIRTIIYSKSIEFLIYYIFISIGFFIFLYGLFGFLGFHETKLNLIKSLVKKECTEMEKKIRKYLIIIYFSICSVVWIGFIYSMYNLIIFTILYIVLSLVIFNIIYTLIRRILFLNENNIKKVK